MTNLRSALALLFVVAPVHAQTFSLVASPKSVYPNENAAEGIKVEVVPANGFTGAVNLSVADLPPGVQAVFNPASTATTSTLVFEADKVSDTGVSTVTVTGISGSLTGTVSINLAVSAATGTGGSGTVVDLSPAYNVTGIYTNGTSFSSGGLDGVGYAFSANLLTPSRILNGTQFNFGPANAPDAVSGTGEPIALPAGQYSLMLILGNGVDGDQINQVLTVTYTDGSSTRFERSFSDWYTPQKYSGEYQAVIMPYRVDSGGGLDSRGNFYLYAYPFLLDSTKTVESLTLPHNRNLVMLALTLSAN